jgi:tetratricopeptide (TPR) repeat protein
MMPAHIPKKVSEELRDVAGMWDALEASCDRFGPHHPQTLAVAHELAIALWHADDFLGAAAILKQALDCLTTTFGNHHAATLAAKGDFGAVLFELGRNDEAATHEMEAFEEARAHLGTTHAVTSVLAWNRALNCERSGQFEAAKEIITSELTWLLTEHPSRLEDDQNIIRSMLADRLRWDSAPAC